MKKTVFGLISFAFVLFACNNEATDSVDQADSINRAKMDSNQNAPMINTDEASTSFLVDATDGGMAEVQLGEMAAQKASHPRVKAFGTLMVQDHSMANDKVKSLAGQRNVTLPDSVSNENKRDIDDLAEKTGNDFDKAFMRKMVNDHESTINLFEKASDKVSDPEVKTFVDNTLPKLRMHLDSARAIQKMLR
jgi:putative membrane protein